MNFAPKSKILLSTFMVPGQVRYRFFYYIEAMCYMSNKTKYAYFINPNFNIKRPLTTPLLYCFLTPKFKVTQLSKSGLCPQIKKIDPHPALCVFTFNPYCTRCTVPQKPTKSGLLEALVEFDLDRLRENFQNGPSRRSLKINNFFSQNRIIEFQIFEYQK